MLSSKLQQEHQRNTVSNSVATIDPMKIMQIHKHCLLTLVYMLGTCDGDSYNENHLLSPTGDATASVAEFAFEPAMALDMKVMEYIFKYLRVKLPKCDAVSSTMHSTMLFFLLLWFKLHFNQPFILYLGSCAFLRSQIFEYSGNAFFIVHITRVFDSVKFEEVSCMIFLFPSVLVFCPSALRSENVICFK